MKYSKDIKSQVVKERKDWLSYGDLYKKYNIPRSSIQQIVNSSNKQKFKTGPKKKLSKNDVRRMKTLIDNNNKIGKKTSSSNIISSLNLNVVRSTVCKELKCVKYSYQNLPTKFSLSYKNKLKRIELVKSYIIKNIKWDRVVFSDEKKFSLYGCDSHFTWMNENQSPYNIRRHLRSPSLMVWAMVLPSGFLSYSIMKGNQNSDKYIEIISNRALPIIKLEMGTDFIFQQDNCPIHVSKKSKEYFKKSGIQLLDWPPNSPDLNIIENIWALLCSLVYQNGPAKTLKDLEYLLLEAVKTFNEKKRGDVVMLYSSIRKRLCDVLQSKGNRIKY